MIKLNEFSPKTYFNQANRLAAKLIERSTRAGQHALLQQRDWFTFFRNTKDLLHRFNDQAMLIQMAKFAAKNDSTLSQVIPNYKIKSENARIEIAKIAAGVFLCEISKYIQNYGIKDETALIEIAKIAANNEACLLAENIQNFAIKDESGLIEIAKIAAHKHSCGLAENIQNFKIQDESALIEIAKICAKRWSALSMYIQDFGIKNKAGLVEIAKTAAGGYESELSKYIRNYKIDDEKARIEIAKIAAGEYGSELSKYIQNYEIDDEKARIEIAEMAITIDPFSVGSFIENFNIEEQQTLIELAKKCADLRYSGIYQTIQNFKIQDEQIRIEIANSSKMKSSIGTWQNINNFSIKNTQIIWDIFSEALIHSIAFNALDNWEKFILLPQGDIKPITVANARDVLTTLYPAEVKKSDHPLVEEQKEQFLLYLYGKCGQKIDESLKLRLPFLLEYREPKNRFRIVNDFIAYTLPNPKSFEFYENLEKQCNKTLQSKGGPILAMILSTLYSKNIEEKTLIAIFDKVKRQANGFYDVLKIQTINRMLLSLLDNPSLDPADIDFLLNKEIVGIEKNRELVLDNSTKIESLCISGFATLLKRDSLKGSTLDDLCKKAFQTACGIENIELLPGQEFFTQYQKSFAQFRSPHMVLTYAGKVQESPEVKEIFSTYISSVLREEFYKVRYDTKTNPHLQKINELNSALYTKWQGGGAKIDFLQADNESQSSFDYFKYCKNVIIDQNHLPKLEIQYLKDYFANPEKKEEILEKLKRCQQTPLLRFQSYCIELCSRPLNEEEIVSHMEKSLIEVDPNIEFLKTDIPLIKNLHAEKSKSALLEIVDSDDPCDLLLMGTEVGGSCQSVNGSSDLNKALLGYIMNGYNRLIAIKDKKKGSILARALMRLALDHELTTPVLYLEPIYPASTSDSHRKALAEFAETRANELRIDFVKTPRSPLHILGGLAPYEYSDTGSTRGIQHGSFTIRG